ncbi:MAG: FG-GAP repeat protein [Stygiobacter sp.]|nr:MAG: FG-GAP repeat protein [Stygiobacter sp.]
MKKSLWFFLLSSLLLPSFFYSQVILFNNSEVEKTLSYYNEQILKDTPESRDIQFIEEHAKLANKLFADTYLTKNTLTQSWVSNEWKNSSQTLYTYTSLNKVDVVITQTWDGSAWVNSTKTDYDYINNTSYDYYIRYSWNGSDWIPDYRWTWTYSGSSQAGQWLEEIYSNSLWSPSSRYIYSYVQGRVSSYTTESYVNQTWRYSFKYINTYLADTDKKTEVLTQYWTNNNWENLAKQIHLFNSSGNEIEYKYYSMSNSVWDEKWRYIYEYLTVPKVSRLAGLSRLNKAVADTDLIKTKTMQTVYTSTQTVYNEKKWEYKYTGTNKQESETRYEWDYVTNGWKQNGRTVKTYNAEDLVSESTEIITTEGLDKNNSKIKYEYEKIVPAAKVNLATSVNPSYASEDGCTVTPSSSQFYKNSIATLDASAGAGWVWDKWTGDLSGDVKPQQLTMSDDKNVTGNFQPVLTLSFTSPNESETCPPELNGEITVGTANIFVDGVDWLLSGISFTAVEKFKPDYTEAWIEYSGEKLKGTINIGNDGYASSISFAPSQQINEGNTLSVRFFYKLNYPSQVADKYIPAALDEVKKYKISIHVGQVDCLPIPASCQPGVKIPKYPPNVFTSNTQTVASVWNISKSPSIPFATIQEAINSALTVEGNIISLCKGVFTENIKVTKSLTIQSANGKELTYVMAKNKDDHVFEISKNNTTVLGLTISGATNLNNAAIFLPNQQIANTVIEDCVISNNGSGIKSTRTLNEATNKVTLNNSIVMKNDSIGVFLFGINLQAENVELTQNKIFGAFISSAKFLGEKIRIHNNYGTALYCSDGIIMTGFENSIELNKGGGLASNEGDITLDGIKIVNNTGGGIFSISGNISINLKNGVPIRTDYISRIDSNYGAIFTKPGGSLSAYNLQVKDNGYMSGLDNTLGGIFTGQVYLRKVKVVGNKGNGLLGYRKIRIEGFENLFRENTSAGIANAHGGIEADGLEVVKNGGGGLFIVEGHVSINLKNGVPINYSYTSRIDSNYADAIVSKPAGSLSAYNLQVMGNGYNNKKEDSFGAAIFMPGEILLEKVSIIKNNSGGILGLKGIRLKGTENVIRGNTGTGIIADRGDVVIDRADIIKNAAGIFNIYGNVYINCNGNNPLYSNLSSRIDSNDLDAIYTRTGSISAFNLTAWHNGYGVKANEGDAAIKAGRDVFLRNVTVIKNKFSGLQARNVMYRRGIVNYNGGWGIIVGGKASDSDLDEGLNVYENTSGAVWFKGGLGKYSLSSNNNASDPPTVIKNSSIINNHGDGIRNDGAESFSIFNTNISGNSGAGINNSNLTATINAKNNWWGNSTGPSGSGTGNGDKVNGNVLFTSWRDKKVSIVSVFSENIMNVTAGRTDSIWVSVQNFENVNDQVNVTVSDSLSWIVGSKNSTVTLKDSLGAGFFVRFAVPANAVANTTNKLNVSVTSVANPNLKSSSQALVKIYSAALERISIVPDSVVIGQTKTAQFNAYGYDQFDKEISFDKTWNATGGNISNSGLFTAGNQTGNFSITVKNNVLNISATAVVRILSSIPCLNKIVVSPDSIKIMPGHAHQFIAAGFDQFDSTYTYNFKWTASGGNVDSNGTFTAGNTYGTFYVLVSDSNGKLSQKAVVIISGTTQVEEEIIPHEYILYQNFPNPFNPTTTIRFAIPQREYVLLKVYDILGREVTALVNEEKSAGNYEVRFNCGKFSSGVYFYQIRAGNFVQTKKFLLLK